MENFYHVGVNQSNYGIPLEVRINSLLDELRCDNEIRQSEACSEISETLLLGNEESLPNFPIRELILALINILNKESNFDLVRLLFLENRIFVFQNYLY